MVTGFETVAPFLGRVIWTVADPAWVPATTGQPVPVRSPSIVTAIAVFTVDSFRGLSRKFDSAAVDQYDEMVKIAFD
jgi:hypothetical protein